MSDSSPTITLRPATAVASTLDADALVVGVRSTAGGLALAPGAEQVDAALGGSLLGTLAALGAAAAPDEVTLLPSGGALAAPVVAVVGLGGEEPSAETLRRAAGAALRRLRGTAATAAFAVRCPDAAAVGALAEGVLLGAYAFDRYRSSASPAAPSAVTLLSELAGDADAETALTRARAVGGAVNRARDWVNTAASDLYPEVFAEQARAEAERVSMEVDVLELEALERDGFGGIVAVGKGSQRPPRLVRLSYRPAGARTHLALVGKGITFDSGGLSLKTADGMVTMKNDMGGAAAVLAAACAIAELGLPIALTAYAAMAENMPSGTAFRPSDVLRMYGGTTVEVRNTDAEGRLVLADAIVRAGEDAPDLIVDVATLTGGCIIALGVRVFGIMSNDEALARRLQALAEEGGEHGWPLPIAEDTRQRLDSTVADIASVSSEKRGGALVGGAMVAASFLEEFVPDGVRWAHVDIAGTAFNDGGAWGYTPSGGTGSGVRTLVRLAEALAGDAR